MLLTIVCFTEFQGEFNFKLSACSETETRRVEDDHSLFWSALPVYILVAISGFDHTYTASWPKRWSLSDHSKLQELWQLSDLAPRTKATRADRIGWSLKGRSKLTPVSQMYSSSLLTTFSFTGNQREAPWEWNKCHQPRCQSTLKIVINAICPRAKATRSHPQNTKSKHSHKMQCFPSAMISSSFSGH